MNKLFEYIDTFPSIPEDLEREVYESIAVNENVWPSKTYTNYKLYHVSNNLELFIHQFLSNHKVKIHVITNHLLIHKDVNRTTAYNYILESGGPNVETCFYDESQILTDSILIMPKKWHKLDVTKYHNVINLESPRIAITVTPL